MPGVSHYKIVIQQTHSILRKYYWKANTGSRN